MPSFTLHSSQHVPWRALRLIGVAAVTWTLGAAYTLRLNPEIVFFRQAAALKLAWSRQIAQTNAIKTIVFGGSSCTFAINNGRLLSEHHLPAANLALGAGMGPRVLIRFALPEVRRGDTLIMAMEPGLLTTPFDDPALGVQFSLALGRPELVAPGDALVPPACRATVSELLMLRPGSYHLFTLMAKVAGRQPLYRYQATEFEPSGWQQTAVRRRLQPAEGADLHLSADARRWLERLRDWCQEKGVRVAYSLPWAYTSPEDLVSFQKSNRQFLLEVAEFLPVLKDRRLGAHIVNEHFADTMWHLTEEGARLRTDELAKQIEDWEIWAVRELKE
jgi:hypothetical protein